MRIPSDIQVNTPAPRSGLLESLGLRVGQTVSAQVIGQTPGGGSTVLIGNQQLTLNLPPGTNLGDLLQLQVSSGGTKPQLALLSQNGNMPNPGTQQNAGQPAAQQPAVTVTTGTSGQPAPGAGQSGAQPAPPSPSMVQQPLPNPPAQGVSNSAPAAAPSAPANIPTPISSQPSIALPQAVQTELNLQPGQLVTARVAQPAANGQPQITIGNQTIQASLPGNPQPGTVLQFQANLSGNAPSLVLQSQGAAHPKQIIPGTLSTFGQQNAQSLQATALPATATTPQQALAQTASTAVARQDSVGTLLLSLSGLAQKGSALPEGINMIGRQLLNQQLDLTKTPLTGEALRNAVARSGVFLETALLNSPVTPQPLGDTKSLLMLMRNMLGGFLAKSDAGLPPGDKRPPPPLKGVLPKGQLLQGGPLAPDTNAQEAARRLFQQTDSALSRMRLFQISSLPEAAARGNPAAMQEWNLELPMVIGGQLNMAQLQITRDPEENANPAERGWHLAFSIHFGPIGEVGARIAWRARKAAIMLWAEEEETATALEENIDDLAGALEASGLEPGSIRVRHGHPDSPAPKSGGFVDESS